MLFREHTLPEFVGTTAAESETTRILKIYNTIDPTGFYDLDKLAHQNELLGEFIDRETYVAVDEERIVGVTLYIPEKKMIEGLAVHPDSRRQKDKHVGSFMVRHLVEIARLDGHASLDIVAMPSSISFWLHQGFIKADAEQPNTVRQNMTLSIK